MSPRVTILLPDGSGFDSRTISGIYWTKSRPGEYGCKAFLRINGYKEKSFGFSSESPVSQQIHYVEMDSDESAEKLCRVLVGAWTGTLSPFKDATAEPNL